MCGIDFFSFLFGFGSVFEKHSDLVRSEFGTVPFKKTRYGSDIIVIYY